MVDFARLMPGPGSEGGRIDGGVGVCGNGLHTAYVLKEQLQALWHSPRSVADMCRRLTTWCDLANASGLPSFRRLAKTLQEHSIGICNYARFPITTARVEAGNVAVGMIRKRARGLLDQDYFKLKIRQSATTEQPLALFPMAR